MVHARKHLHAITRTVLLVEASRIDLDALRTSWTTLGTGRGGAGRTRSTSPPCAWTSAICCWRPPRCAWGRRRSAKRSARPPAVGGTTSPPCTIGCGMPIGPTSRNAGVDGRKRRDGSAGSSPEGETSPRYNANRTAGPSHPDFNGNRHQPWCLASDVVRPGAPRASGWRSSVVLRSKARRRVRCRSLDLRQLPSRTGLLLGPRSGAVHHGGGPGGSSRKPARFPSIGRISGARARGR